MSLAFAAALLAPAAPVSARAPGPSASPSAPTVSFADPRGPMIQVHAASGGPCAYLWNGRATAESDLLERAVTFVEDAVRHLGGVANVTLKNFPAANFDFGEEAPWRCVRGMLETVASSGFVELRIADPDPSADPWANPLVFELDLPEESDPSVDPAYNRVGLSRRGAPTWNDIEIDLIKLRQYSDITQTMDPIPSLRLEMGEQAPYRDVGPILGVIWRARVQQVELSPPGSRRGDRKPGLRLSATNIVR